MKKIVVPLLFSCTLFFSVIFSAQHSSSELFSAIESADQEKLNQLLKNGANPNQKDRYGHTPMMRAADELQTAMVRTLLAHGANVNAKDMRGDTVFNAVDRRLRFYLEQSENMRFKRIYAKLVQLQKIILAGFVPVPPRRKIVKGAPMMVPAKKRHHPETNSTLVMYYKVNGKRTVHCFFLKSKNCYESIGIALLKKRYPEAEFYSFT